MTALSGPPSRPWREDRDLSLRSKTHVLTSPEHNLCAPEHNLSSRFSGTPGQASPARAAWGALRKMKVCTAALLAIVVANIRDVGATCLFSSSSVPLQVDQGSRGSEWWWAGGGQSYRSPDIVLDGPPQVEISLFPVSMHARASSCTAIRLTPAPFCVTISPRAGCRGASRSERRRRVRGNVAGPPSVLG